MKPSGHVDRKQRAYFRHTFRERRQPSSRAARSLSSVGAAGAEPPCAAKPLNKVDSASHSIRSAMDAAVRVHRCRHPLMLLESTRRGILLQVGRARQELADQKERGTRAIFVCWGLAAEVSDHVYGAFGQGPFADCCPPTPVPCHTVEGLFPPSQTHPTCSSG